MKQKQINTEIFRTNKYDMFKKLVGQREANPKRVKKIKDSIEKIGYINNPIIVNDKYEVIDGQGRLEALKELGLPIEYIVKKGIGIDECLYLNLNQEKWKIIDYVKSYAERGNENYKKFLELIDYYPIYSISTIGCACKDWFSFTNSAIKNGKLELSTNDYEQAVIRLNYVNKYIPMFKYLKGKITYFAQAIISILWLNDVDLDRLFNQINKNISELQPFSDVNTCLQGIEELYNKGLGNWNRVYIFTEYRQRLAEGLRGTKSGLKPDYKVGDKKIEFINRRIEKINEGKL